MSVKLILAPLHGVTIRVFRDAYFSSFGGFDEAVAPFVAAVPDAHSVRDNHFKDILPVPKTGPVLVPQIMGNEPVSLASTARAIGAMGYGEVNWNLGCPYPMVARKKRGAGLLPHPDMVERGLRALCEAHAGGGPAVSVKLRLGMANVAEFDALLPILNAYPLASVTLHPRLASQMYEGQTLLDDFERVAPLVKAPLTFNGDIRRVEDFARLRERFPYVSAWMIGRGAIMDPLLPARLKGLTPPEDGLSPLRLFHERLYDAYEAYLHGPRHLLDKMKEVWAYLAYSFPEPERVIRELYKAKSPREYRLTVAGILA